MLKPQAYALVDPNAMQVDAWEYKTLTSNPSDSHMGQLGADGWEAFAAVIEGSTIKVFFKRRVRLG